MKHQMQQKVEDLQHGAAYNARIKELDHISYRVREREIVRIITRSTNKGSREWSLLSRSLV